MSTFVALAESADAADAVLDALDGDVRLSISGIMPLEASKVGDVAGGADRVTLASEPSVVLRVAVTASVLPSATELASAAGLIAAWRTDQIVARDDGVTPAAATRSRFGLVTRRPELSTAEFESHYRRVHIPLVLSTQPLFDRYLVDLVREGTDAGIDSIVDQRFSDIDTWLEHDRRILEERPAVRADIPTFVAGMRQYVSELLESRGR